MVDKDQYDQVRWREGKIPECETPPTAREKALHILAYRLGGDFGDALLADLETRGIRFHFA